MISKQTQSELNSLPPYSDGVNLNLEELLQYKQQSVHWQPPAKSLWTQLLGQHQSRQLGRGMDFSEVRQYQAGDDIRAIDWRVTARTGKPHTKLFSEEREKPVVLYLDMRRSMLFGSKLMLKSVQMSHMASLIGWLSVIRQDRIGAIVDTGDSLIELKPMSRQKGVLAILQQLIVIHRQQLQALPSANTSFSAHQMDVPLKALARMCPKGSEIIMISDFSDLSSLHKALLSQLCRHNQMRMVQISDPLEYGATHYRGTQQVSDQYQKKHWLNFGSQKTRNQLEMAFNQQQQQLKQMALSLGISFSSISTDRALTHQLHGQ